MYDIEVKDLSVYYGSVCALKNVNLKVKNKEFLGIIGPNGGGKTTLLKVLLGLVKPTNGSIFIKRDNTVGYVPQFTFFDRDFPINVMDVILMGKLPKKFKLFHRYSSQDKKRAEEIMKKLGIIEFKNRQIGQLSGGQLQKVLIARALINDPKILMLDEPTASIDSKTKIEIYEMLKKLNKDKTILIISHDMQDIFSYIDSVIYINKTLQYYNHRNNLKLNKKVFKNETAYTELKER
ncbi:metal ABC transporter ATP-binding protein [Tepidibacter formicigenes]|jgi:zinc transport system ATP-binding protein|uniref:Zinc transport system ATP-binding protein n=1 Tax=Tepidibacter formicigenes DSM 15518 TaxID=1123349 RepID=A0A1M6S4L6_9FIRM|nr:ABC transporter ATP-binding protein [Tepidibacter formicigenes]SHK39609.1 zinc transport system ATP-binding protein [Tepidibacter formicigenes DSM 15518]